jgi:hypothetical protein
MICAIASFCCGGAFAAELSAVDSELEVRLKPDAALKARRKEQLDLYRNSVAGDAEAARAWEALKPAVRTSLLAELAAAKEESAARTHAIRELAKLSPSDDPESLALLALVRVAVAEGDGSLRTVARTGLVARDDARAPAWLLDVVERSDELVRANAIAALKAIGSPRVYEVIIEHWKEIWGASPRDHCFFGTMRSYVADYEISGDAYSPVVRNFFTGVVLDGKVLRVEGDIYFITIREVAPEDVKLPNDPAAWEKWLQQERDKLARVAEAKKRAAVEALSAADKQ